MQTRTSPTTSAAPGGTASPAPSDAQLQPVAAAPGFSLVLPGDRTGLEAYIDQLKKVEVGFECGLTFARMLQGACLAELRKIIQKPGYRTDLTSPNNSERLGWQDYVKSRFGFSDDTARARIAMWEAGKPRLKKLAEDAQAGLAAIFDRPISSLSEGEFQVVQQVTHKLTDGKTVRMIQEELGLFKGDAAKPTGGYRERRDITPEQRIAEQNARALSDWEIICRGIDGFFAENLHTLIGKDQRSMMADLFRQAAKRLDDVK